MALGRHFKDRSLWEHLYCSLYSPSPNCRTHWWYSINKSLHSPLMYTWPKFRPMPQMGVSDIAPCVRPLLWPMYTWPKYRPKPQMRVSGIVPCAGQHLWPWLLYVSRSPSAANIQSAYKWSSGLWILKLSELPRRRSCRKRWWRKEWPRIGWSSCSYGKKCNCTI